MSPHPLILAHPLPCPFQEPLAVAFPGASVPSYVEPAGGLETLAHKLRAAKTRGVPLMPPPRAGSEATRLCGPGQAPASLDNVTPL